MIPGLTSVIIPTFNHAEHLAEAVRCALRQTAPVEVLVVDDGSTDATLEVLHALASAQPDGRLRVLPRPHRGPAAARNAGIEAALGEFVQFLDADDLIAPTKVAEQLEAFDAETGWVLCDVRIEHLGGRVEHASHRYGYAAKGVGGWIADLLAVGNLVPIHSPLVRRAAIGAIRFPEDRPLEDWHFWHAIAEVARCRYLPRVLATYRKRLGGRNAGTKVDRATAPGVVLPLRLNLGCGTPGARSWHPMRGLVNLDKSLGWRFEDGLGEFADGSVAGITVSHSLMYVRLDLWPSVVGEFARVLAPGGVLRITEDDTEHPASSRRGGWKGSEPAVTLTGPKMARRFLEAAGFRVHDVDRATSHYRDGSLCQAQHGDAPDCFWIEGIREAAVLFEPHADDGPLFAAFSILRHRPRVVTCFPSAGDYGDTATRAAETAKAVGLLGGGPCEQWDGVDLVGRMRELDARLRPTIVFAPSADTSHPQHVAVARAAAEVFGERVRKFQTYVERQDLPPGMVAHAKVRRGNLVPHEPGWEERKRIALACYRTQLAHPRAREFFAWDLAEYLEP